MSNDFDHDSLVRFLMLCHQRCFTEVPDQSILVQLVGVALRLHDLVHRVFPMNLFREKDSKFLLIFEPADPDREQHLVFFLAAAGRLIHDLGDQARLIDCSS